MKTIEELEKEIYEAQSCEEVDCSAFIRDNLNLIKAQEDVIKLIDEMNRKMAFGKPQFTIGWNNALTELKTRIER